MRVEAKAKMRNRAVKSELKTLEKKFTAAVDAGDKDAAGTLCKEYSGALDKAALKGTIHKNNCDRKKAQAAKALNTVAQ